MLLDKKYLVAFGLLALLTSCGSENTVNTPTVSDSDPGQFWAAEQYQIIENGNKLTATPGQVETVNTAGEREIYTDKPSLTRDGATYLPLLFLTQSDKYDICSVDAAIGPTGFGYPAAVKYELELKNPDRFDGMTETEVVLDNNAQCVAQNCSSFVAHFPKGEVELLDYSNPNASNDFKIDPLNPDHAVWTYYDTAKKKEITINLVKKDLSDDVAFKNCTKNVNDHSRWMSSDGI